MYILFWPLYILYYFTTFKLSLSARSPHFESSSGTVFFPLQHAVVTQITKNDLKLYPIKKLQVESFITLKTGNQWGENVNGPLLFLKAGQEN